MQDAIGGFFQLETPLPRVLYDAPLGYNSARYAFEALLRHVHIRRLHLPWYTCATMVDAAQRSGVELYRYGLDDQLQPREIPTLEADERLLYVDYFGYKAITMHALASTMGASLIADHAQALFSPPPAGVPTLYSPRKFLGVPDGGWLINPPSGLAPLRAGRSQERLRALAGRLEDGPEAWYSSYVEVERGIREEGMTGMSPLTERLLGAIDYATVADRRRANLRLLQAAFESLNRFTIAPDFDGAPLCYPLLLGDAAQTDVVRARLARQRIYVATYWRDVLETQGACATAVDWARCLLPLPLDQRYGPEEMRRLIEAVYLALD
ncbi:hypothetical protein [Pseudomonas sp. DC3000-4b1]|uniref:hypothetical protein n=1 Tax=unclassified Pseudomonas TaxID=196821 RepID=UPI003CE94D0F